MQLTTAEILYASLQKAIEEEKMKKKVKTKAKRSPKQKATTALITPISDVSTSKKKTKKKKAAKRRGRPKGLRTLLKEAWPFSLHSRNPHEANIADAVRSFEGAAYRLARLADEKPDTKAYFDAFALCAIHGADLVEMVQRHARGEDTVDARLPSDFA